MSYLFYNLKLMNLKQISILSLLIFIFTHLNGFCFEFNPYSLFLMVKPKYERTNSGNWNNNSIQVGLKIDERINTDIYELNYHKKIDLFNIGVNLKTNKYSNFETFQNFQLFDYSILGNLLHCCPK